MYDKVYDVEAGVAKKLDGPMWVDKDGKEPDEGHAIVQSFSSDTYHP